jgi:hypothetical protein
MTFSNENLRRTQIMKKSLMALTAVMSSVVAQAGDLRATIPFAFTVASKPMPAGTYLLKTESSGLMLVRGEKGAAFKLLSGMPTPAQNTLVFDCSKGCELTSLTTASPLTDAKLTASQRMITGTMVAGN